MTDYRKEAQKLESELTANRRTVHGFAETAFDLPQTLAFVETKLKEMGLTPKRVGKAGISCLLGKEGGKTILLRADMDALPMEEKTGLPFAAKNGHCHSCGHDCHTAMLLGAAKLLKTHEAELQGQVKLMFQPAEEKLAGAQDMIDHGILEAPHVDAALGMHVLVGPSGYSQCGTFSYKPGCASFSGDAIRITVTGKDAHGSTPELGVDAINIAAHIVIALQEILAREVSCSAKDVVLVGMIQGGTSCNTNAGSCMLEVSVRSDSREGRAFLKQRVKEISEATAAAFRGKASVDYVYGMPSLYNDEMLCKQMDAFCREIVGDAHVKVNENLSGTEDFTMVADRVPAVFLHLGAGSAEEGHTCGMHNPGMLVDESVLPLGAAVYAHCAVRYLEENR